MSAIYPTLPKLAVRDGFDEDDLTDIDDEVFIRDGKNGGLKLDDDGGVKRPLMAPRRKCKKSCSFETHKFPLRALLIPLCYGIIALIVLLGLIVLCIFTANIFPMPLTLLKNWLTPKLKSISNESNVVPCTSLATKILWTRSLPKLTAESPLRSNDVNSDGIEDIIVGFSTGLDTIDTPEYICALYFEGQVPCLGGVLALNGKTGETLWTHWTTHAIFSVDCGLDLTNDKTKDCIIAGRGGILHAINGRDGSSIWEIPIQDLLAVEEQRVLDVYDAKFIADTDGDGIGDVIASHSVQSGGLHSNEILLISGTTGNIIHTTNLPDTEQIFLAPQMLVHPDGESNFVLVTSSQKQSGGLYIVPQVNLMYGDLKLRKLHHDTGLLPPILVDVTLDGVEDIIAAMFNSTIIAYDGLTFEPIWNYTIPNSEVISIPIPGYYNDDETPDFMVKHQIGSGFPTYYYTVATVIDGKTGKPLLEKPMEDSLSRQMSGLSVTVDGFGNDWFLHWSVDCLNYEGAKEKYQFLKGESLISETRADLCKLRFNSTLTTNLFALSQHVGPPGISLYFSEDWRSLEFNNSIDPRMESYIDVPFVSERSPRIHKGHRKESAFRHANEGVSSNVNKYNPAGSYENFADYKARKKLPPSEFKNENTGDFSVDYPWKHSNKWTRENIQANKDYDMTYDSESNLNVGDEQPADYSQVDEVREQRSDIGNDLSFDYTDIQYDSNKNLSSDTFEKWNNDTIRSNIKSRNTVLKKREANFSEEIAHDIQNSTEVDSVVYTMKTSTEINLLNTSDTVPGFEERYNTSLEKLEIPTSNSMNVTSGNTSATFSPIEYSSTERISTVELDDNTANVTENSMNVESTAHEEEDEGRTPIYLHNFLNIVRNNDEDASIEKIFKRESLKNRGTGRNPRARVNVLSDIVREHGKKVHAEKKKRETQTQSGHSRSVYGIQKQPPTGILLPSILESKGKTSVDLVFSTFWLPSSEISVILLQEDMDCIHRKKALSEKKLHYRENDDIVKECLAERGIDYKIYQEAMDRENFKISLGQMTVYRMKLECVCPEDMLPNQSCKNISSRQSWPEHLGAQGNGYFKPLRNSNV